MIITLPKDEDLIDKINSFTIQATSKNPLNESEFKDCFIQINFTLL